MKLPKWFEHINCERIEAIASVGILVFAILATFFAWDASKVANDINNRSLSLQQKLYDYPVKVYPSTYFAMIEGFYQEGSTLPASAHGFLNATLLVNTPDIVRVTIENMSFQNIKDVGQSAYYKVASNGSLITVPIFSETFNAEKFDEWKIVFATNNHLLRAYPYPSKYNNFTYYTNSIGISTINVSLPIESTFYFNPKYTFEVDSQNRDLVELGRVTVYGNAYDMQTERQMNPINFTAQLFANMRIQR